MRGAEATEVLDEDEDSSNVTSRKHPNNEPSAGQANAEVTASQSVSPPVQLQPLNAPPLQPLDRENKDNLPIILPSAATPSVTESLSTNAPAEIGSIESSNVPQAPSTSTDGIVTGQMPVLSDSMRPPLGAGGEVQNTNTSNSRCHKCNKRLGLLGFSCRCGGIFCRPHLHAEEHACSFDYQQLGRQTIQSRNPKVVSAKVDRF